MVLSRGPLGIVDHHLGDGVIAGVDGLLGHVAHVDPARIRVTLGLAGRQADAGQALGDGGHDTAVPIPHSFSENHRHSYRHLLTLF